MKTDFEKVREFAQGALDIIQERNGIGLKQFTIDLLEEIQWDLMDLLENTEEEESLRDLYLCMTSNHYTLENILEIMDSRDCKQDIYTISKLNEQFAKVSNEIKVKL